MATFLRKLTSDSVVDVSRLPKPTEPTWLFRVAGMATGFETGNTQYGKWTSLKGEFQATRFDTGEVFESDTLFLPCGMAEMIAARIESHQTTNPDMPIGIETIFDIGWTVPKRPSERGYEYIIRNPDPESATRSAVHAMLTRFPTPNGKLLGPAIPA